MSINVEVKKSGNENAIALIRRFQKRVQEAGILPRVRSLRYSDRPLSKLKRKRGKLKNLARRKVYERLKKLGKITIVKKRRHRR